MTDFTAKDFILCHDNLLSAQECEGIREWFTTKKELQQGQGHLGYLYADHNRNDPIDIELQPLLRAIAALEAAYVTSYPETTTIANDWFIPWLRFKWWKPGTSFGLWHCEHTFHESQRVFGFLLYLSDNDCDTEFYRFGTYKTKAGRAVMFPTQFTHTHRGMVSADGKDRYAISGYFYLSDNRNPRPPALTSDTLPHSL